MKKLILSLSLLGIFTIANAGCYQAVRKCKGEWTAYNCISDTTSDSCRAYYCNSCGERPDPEI